MDKKFLILLFYYNRPNQVRTSLESIKNHEYQNWELCFIDDGSEEPGEPIVREILSDQLNKIRFMNTHDTIETKTERNKEQGSVFGKFAQQAVEESDADYVIMLCDDDALYPNYLNNLNQFFNSHPEDVYVYSHIHIYDPVLTSIKNNPPFVNHHLNKTEEVCPFYSLDMSQISWNRKKCIDAGVKFRYPLTANLDAELYLQMYSAFGKCRFTGFIGQYKAMDMGGYKDQLSHRMGQRLINVGNPEDVYKIKIK
jgi:glycosyltransferase involved in cell wall biosynthesis